MNLALKTPSPTAAPVGDLLRDWRLRRHLSQLALAGLADVSARHLSYLETGRAQPSREMLLRLTDRLQIPLRERNVLFLAAGFAPMYKERSLDDPALLAARRALDLVLKGHEPYPALAVDRHWNLVAMNKAAPLLLQGIAEHLLQPPINVMRAALHPEGLSSRIVNLAQIRHHLLARLQAQIDASNDAGLIALHAELSAHAGGDMASELGTEHPGVMVPLQVRVGDQVLSFISTLTVFGSPLEITLSELAVEAFFPADQATAACLLELSQATSLR